MPFGPPNYSFEARLAKARDEIDDALNLRLKPLGPVPNQQPMQIPGNPQLTPQGMSFSDMQQLGPGMLSGNAMVGPQGFSGASANYGMPVAGGQLNVGGSVTPGMDIAQLQAQYQRGPFSAGLQYQPGAGVSGGVQFRKQFQEGGLATSLRTNPADHERDVAFVASRDQQLRDMAGKRPFAKGGLAAVGPQAMSDEELAKAFSSEGNNSAIMGEVNRRIKAKLLDKFGGDEAAANQFLRTTNDPLGILLGRAAYAKGGGAWTRKEGKNPEGGLNAKGRASLKAQGHDIKPPVSAKQAKKSPKAAARRRSFCARMSGMPGAMKDENGKPTRKALALRKWDC